MNCIGPHIFRTLSGHPVRPSQRVVVESRPGVPGVAVWLSGRRGDPFTLRSTSGFINLAGARAEYTWYTELIGGDPQEMAYFNLNMNIEGRVLVLDVKQVALHWIACDTGGALALLVCDWQLIMV